MISSLTNSLRLAIQLEKIRYEFWTARDSIKKNVIISYRIRTENPKNSNSDVTLLQ